MKLLSALTVLLAQGHAAPLPDDSNNPRNGGLRSSTSHRAAKETSDGPVDLSYWNAPVKDVGLTCIDNSIRAGGGKPLSTCIREGEALCIEYERNPPMGGKWTFGVKDSMVKLWNPRMEAVWEFCTEVTHVCIGEVHGYDPNRYSKERPYLTFYNEKTHLTVGNLTCDGTDGKVSIFIIGPGQIGVALNISASLLTSYAIFSYINILLAGRQESRPVDNPQARRQFSSRPVHQVSHRYRQVQEGRDARPNRR